jgi:hypothetical protein
VRATGEEDPVDRAPHLLHARPGERTGKDHHIPGGDSDDQLARHRIAEVVPEPVGEQHAGLQPVEGEHQRGRLAVDAHPVQRRVQVRRRVPA